MDICNRVKIFKNIDPVLLEKAINEWFENNPVLLVDVKFNITPCSYPDIYTAMIIYQ